MTRSVQDNMTKKYFELTENRMQNKKNISEETLLIGTLRNKYNFDEMSKIIEKLNEKYQLQ